MRKARSLPARSKPPYRWPLLLNLFLLLLAGLVLLPPFLHDPNLTLITLGLIAGLGLNFVGAALALALGRWLIVGWFMVGMLFVLSACWVAVCLVPPALLPRQ